MKLSALLCALLWSLVEVHGQTEFPYVSFRGETLPNHSYVDLTLVGSGDGGPGVAVMCHTDLPSCCDTVQGPYRGSWFFPNGSMLSDGDIYETCHAERLDLGRRNHTYSPSGLYHCDIPTVAVHDEIDNSMGETVYVGLYAIGGDITISGGITMTVDSNLNGPSPQFTLTCISTGGPATTVTWTRDSVTVVSGTNSVLDDPVTAQYTHTLTVTGRLGGFYTCIVANDKPSSGSAHFNVEVPQQSLFPPTNVMAVQESPGKIRVSWTPSPMATGYRMEYYTNDGSGGTVSIGSGHTDNFLLKRLQAGHNYTISIVAVSDDFTSESVTVYASVDLSTVQPIVLAPPTDVVAFQEGPNKIRVSWTPSPMATGYRMEYTTNGGSGGTVSIGSGDTDNFLLKRLQAGHNYTIFIVAVSDDFTSEIVTVYASVDLSTVQPLVVTPPTNVMAVQEGPNSIRVSWVRSALATGYRMKYFTNDGSGGTVSIGSGHTGNFLLKRLQAGHNYTISIVAVSDDFISESVTVYASVNLLPGQPIISMDPTPSSTSISLSWSVPNGAVVDSYEVFWTSNECPMDVHEGSAVVTGTSYTIDDLRGGSSYNIIVTATNSAGISISNRVIAETNETTPSGAPPSVSIAVVNSTAITVLWGMVPCRYQNGNITGYSVRYEVKGQSIQTINVPRGDIFKTTISSLALSTSTYSIQVAAVNSAGTGIYSDPLVVQFPRKQCGNNEFQCPGDENGLCLPHFFLCDSHMDCLDGYDEQNCSKIELGSPPEVSVVEGREKDIQICLTVTEVREHHYIFRQYTFESIPVGKVNYGKDFVTTYHPSTVTFNGSYSVGDSECVMVNVHALEDSLVDSTERFTVLIQPEINCNPVVFIIDNDYLRVGFPEASYTVSESAGVVELVVRPFEDENGSISNIEIPLGVRIKTRDGSAEVGRDYQNVLSTGYFRPFYSKVLAVRINILDDDLPEGEESFTVELFAFDISLVLVNSVAEIVIKDDDGTALTCPPLLSPTNGSVQYSGVDVGAVAEYSCDCGFLLVGVYNRECKLNYVWSDKEPTCQNMYPDGVCTVDQVIVDVNGATATFSFCGVGSDIVSFLCKLDGVILPTCSSPLTDLTPGTHRLRIVSTGCASRRGKTIRFEV